MKQRWIYAVVAAIAVGITLCPATGQESAPKPGPEVERLAFLVGNWTLEGVVQPGVFGPGGKFSETSRGEWMEGGFFVIVHEHYAGAVGDSDAISFTGYDQERGVYTYWGFGSGGETEISTGQNTGNRWVWSRGGKMKGQAATIRYTVVVTSPSTYSFKSEISTDGANWTLFLEGNAHKGG